MAIELYFGLWFSLALLLIFYAFVSWFIYRINELSKF
jgi:hypothetical protein